MLAYPDRAEGEVALDDGLRTAIDAAIRDDRSTTVETGAGTVFVQVFNPPLRMLIVGAVHIAQPLARMAAVSGYDVHRDRSARRLRHRGTVSPVLR